MEASVSEIHRYPLRPEGFEEPLFPTRESRRRVLDHLLRAPWLSLASEMESICASGQAAHTRREPVELENLHGRVRILWSSGRRRCRKRRHVVEVLGRWREVRAWWDETRAKDRSLVRVLLSDDSVVDLARENDGEWFLVGVTD
ncbi:MAG: hypothetical protein M3Q62_11785 [Actinomycetota bacterium]|jgi:hypothetical protein|nr:hypothetical protein [Actinomycetota bacterium]MDQ3498365.1 hypothetical protein [Actinomycetota bacterium]